jgi:hypothetical protein
MNGYKRRFKTDYPGFFLHHWEAANHKKGNKITTVSDSAREVKRQKKN